jgi:3-oxoacyl-[acyl-carrier-protein] synthase-3
MAPKKTARVIGMGSYLPERVLSNHDLEKMVDTDDEWIASRTGIKERRIAGENEFTSTMGLRAAERAIKNAKINVDQIQMVIVATMSSDTLCPGTAVLIQQQLKISHIPAFDLQAACSGYLYALSLAKAYIEAGMYQHILVVAAEKMSAFVDYTDRNTCILFGDGASASIVAAEGNGLLIDTINLGADGDLSELIYIPAGGSRLPASHATVDTRQHFIKLAGKEVFKHAVRRMTHAAKEVLALAGISENEVKWLIPHQANERIMDAIAKNFEIAPEKVFKTIQKYGNTSASSIAIALDELQQQHALTQGDHLLLVAFGAGLTWGAAVLTQTDS